MRILWLSHLIPYPPKAGVLLRSYNLLLQLARVHDVDLLSFVQMGYLETFYPSYESGIADTRQALSAFCKHVEFIPIPSEQRPLGKYFLAAKSLFTKKPYSINWLSSPLYSKSLSRLVAENRYDIIHFDTISLAPYRLFCPSVKTVLDHHNIESHMMLRRAENAHLLARPYYWQEGLRLRSYERKVCSHFDLHITCSELDAQRLLKVDPGLSVKVMPNGVDPLYFCPAGRNTADKTVIFVGSMNWYPNVEAMRYFISAVWPALKREVPDAKLHVVGAHPPRSLLDLAQLDPSITFFGFVSDVRPYLEEATVYVCPITDGGGTKLKLLDAFAMGKAVVAHPIACEGINAKHGESIMLATTAEEFVSRIRELFADASLRGVIGGNARKLVLSQYAYDSIGRDLCESYERLCGLGSEIKR
ncbi:glycosyltransferase family 4 protein [Geomonas ferrireducens]|uniref:glycosyltransferase family 4 protein n=1 Tax=Geomonas ferrireducens TaxID=2570227 RepID=UPI0010A93B1C|nr:glycosyltransferase family 4 protein [Geomonas ferrireducens]